MSKDLKNIGLYNKYNITKTNGEPLDANSEYFVLRLDYGGSDKWHIEACRLAIITYAAHISYSHNLHELYKDIMERYGWETIARKIMKDIVYDNGFVDRWHPETDALYPDEWVEKLKEASKIFFGKHTDYLTIKDIESIAIGCYDENVEEYGRFPEYEQLERTINEYYEKVLI